MAESEDKATIVRQPSASHAAGRAGRAIITGASSGIGAALARELSRRGWSLALLARRQELLDQLVSELKTDAVALAADVTDRDAVRDAVARGSAALGGDFDLAVANAGISVPTWSTKFNVDDAERIIRVNVLGMFYLFDATIPAMLGRGSGRFAGIASIAGLRGLPSASVYSASKAAMQAFLEASRGSDLSGEALWEALRPAVEAALAELTAMRAREGAALGADLGGRKARLGRSPSRRRADPLGGHRADDQRIRAVDGVAIDRR